MANKLCRYTLFKPVDSLVIDVEVPVGKELSAGQVIMLESYADIAGNKWVWKAVAPEAAKLGSKAALIINGGEFETLEDGRRPEGNPDFTTMSYKARSIAPAIIVGEATEFEISYDAIDGTPAVGSYLEPVDGKETLSVVATRTDGTKSGLKIVALNNFRAGGHFGGKFIQTVIARNVE